MYEEIATAVESNNNGLTVYLSGWLTDWLVAREAGNVDDGNNGGVALAVENKKNGRAGCLSGWLTDW